MEFTNEGHCPCCENTVRFEARNAWLRDYYVCPSCGSIPRERALMWTLANFFPAWRSLQIHESSPVCRGASARLRTEGQHYVPSQYFPEVPPGREHSGMRCENLEHLSFPAENLDLHVTQDVMEHIFDPAAAFREVARTLRPGGAHVFTTPLVNKDRPSECRARLRANGSVEHLHPPEYHGNPVSADGSLVTMHWGYDITDYIATACGLHTTIVHLDDLSHGIRAEYIEVLVTRKPGRANTP